jgi:hypothetical protein
MTAPAGATKPASIMAQLDDIERRRVAILAGEQARREETEALETRRDELVEQVRAAYDAAARSGKPADVAKLLADQAAIGEHARKARHTAGGSGVPTIIPAREASGAFVEHEQRAAAAKRQLGALDSERASLLRERHEAFAQLAHEAIYGEGAALLDTLAAAARDVSEYRVKVIAAARLAAEGLAVDEREAFLQGLSPWIEPRQTPNGRELWSAIARVS